MIRSNFRDESQPDCLDLMFLMTGARKLPYSLCHGQAAMRMSKPTCRLSRIRHRRLRFLLLEERVCYW